jgi:hypothetical protein
MSFHTKPVGKYMYEGREEWEKKRQINHHTSPFTTAIVDTKSFSSPISRYPDEEIRS